MSWVEWIETKRLVSARPEETVAAAVERMVEERVGALLVLDGDGIAGIFTERDVLRRVLAPGRDPQATKIGEVCTPDPKVVREDTPVEQCARMIRDYGFRHVPVVDDSGRPIGMISSRDFLRFVVGELERLIAKAYDQQRIEQLVDPYASISVGNID